MPRILLLMEYDGTDFVGWQHQLNGRAVQDVVERGLEKLLGEKVEAQSASRTDSGVHALAMPVSFVTTRDFPMKAFEKGLNGLLPPDVSVKSARVVDDGFDPRRQSSGKIYRYLVSNDRMRSPTRRRSHWELYQPLDVERMIEGAKFLVGRHDFSAFRSADCDASHAMRKVLRLEVSGVSGGEISFLVHGTAFLKHMVRNLVGSLVEVGKGKREPSWIREVLEGKDRTVAGPTAPAHGLTLVEVFYGSRAESDAA